MNNGGIELTARYSSHHSLEQSTVCFASFHPRPVALFFNSINHVYSFFHIVQFILQLFLCLLQPYFFFILRSQIFPTFLVNIPEGLFLASISPLQISMKCLTLASHQSALSPILQSSTNKYFIQFSTDQSPSKQFNSINNSNKLEKMLRIAHKSDNCWDSNSIATF